MNTKGKPPLEHIIFITITIVAVAVMIAASIAGSKRNSTPLYQPGTSNRIEVDDKVFQSEGEVKFENNLLTFIDKETHKLVFVSPPFVVKRVITAEDGI